MPLSRLVRVPCGRRHAPPSARRPGTFGMGRSLVPRAVLWALVAVVAGARLAGAAPPPRPPNVVVILADDLGFSDLGCYGGEIDTPHLDALAAGGLRFTQGYDTARCWPSRAALLTGYYPQSIHRDALPGGEGGSQGRRPAWARLLPHLLEPAGYRSYHCGKWHVDGAPLEQGFVKSLVITGSGESNFFDPSGVIVDGRPAAAAADFYATSAIGDHAVKCLAGHARDHAAAPFFLYLPFTAPHFPLQAPQELVAKYLDRYRIGWDAVREARARRLAAAGIVTTPAAAAERNVGPPYPFPDAWRRLGPGEVNRPLPWTELSAEQREFQAAKMAIHAAMVEAMDREVGRVVEQLREMRAFDDTLVLFASDNGASAEIMIRGEGHDPAAAPGSRKTFLCLGPGWSTAANTPFRRHKTWTHEGGIATPWIVHWPRGIVARGEFRHQPVHLVDVTPTVLDLAGVAPPREHAGVAVPPMQGRSFAATLAAAAAPPPHEALWWCHEGHRAVRVGDWKLVAAQGTPWELYDLARDRCETNDLAAREPDRVADLQATWQRIADECQALARPAARPTVVPKAAAHPPAAPGPGRRPNIIYVMTDDQGYGDIAAHGNPLVVTPHLDRLHRHSVRLTEFHASPTCSPTRAALLSGRHEFRSGVTHTIEERERLALSATTLPHLLGTAGYACGIFGKWHLGDEDAYQPARRGFHRTFIHGAGGIGQSYPGSCGDVPGNSYLDPVIRSDGTFVKAKGYCTDVFFSAAIEWIDRCRREGTPFFCYLAPNAPHGPLVPPPGAEAPVRARLAAADAAARRPEIARFYAMIENIDDNMGRLLDALRDWGIAEQTLVVFTTDNGTAAGAAVCNDGMRGAKGSPYRGGTRVPSFWHWPGTLPEGVDVPAVTAHIDVLPTLCEIAGVGLPEDVAGRVEGRSLVPLLRDVSAPWPDRMLVTHLGRWDRGRAATSAYANCRIREGRWQLVNTRNRRESWELYDVSADPGEARDVAAAHPDVVARLAAAYDEWWDGIQEDLINEEVTGPADNPFRLAFHRQQDQSGERPPPATTGARRPERGKPAPPPPTVADHRYGPHPKQVLHFWKAPTATAEKPAPLVYYIHGGGWQSGHRLRGVDEMLPALLEAGISVASVEYRFIAEATLQGVEPPVKAPLHDAARGLQTVRSMAAEWHVDPRRIAASGGSAGGCTSLWLAFHDDLADPGSADPVARQSTRLLAAAVVGAQTTLDPAQMKAWTPNSEYGGHAFGLENGPGPRFAGFLAARERLLPWIAAYSPYALVSADDPPVYLLYKAAPDLGKPQQDPTHSANCGVKLQERLRDAGVACELVYPGAADVTHASLQDYLVSVLGQDD